jgi:hypothetical protein
MAYEQKPNSGAIFRVEDKKSDTHADYNGSAVIDGVEYFVDGWINEIKSGARAGKKFLSIKFKPKEHRPQQSGGSSRQQTQQPSPAESDDIPF